MADTDWTAEQNDLAVTAYFEMLGLELSGHVFRKAPVIRRVMAATGRSKGSVEFKFENISAVLHEAGYVFVDGYKPAKNYQRALAQRVSLYLQAHPGPLQAVAPAPVVASEPKYVAAPIAPRPRRSRALRDAIARHLDFAAIDAANRALGKAGERLVANAERRRLAAAGREDLAARVIHVAEQMGDGLGYDVGSFRSDGTLLRIEVKTTNGPRSAPFYISTAELEESERDPESYELHRVFSMSRRPQVFVLTSPLVSHVRLEAVSYRCIVGTEVADMVP